MCGISTKGRFLSTSSPAVSAIAAPRIGGRGVGVSLGVFAAVTWGGQFIAAKSVFAHVGPFEINAIRYLPISVILLAVLLRVEGRRALSFEGRGRALWLLGVGVVCFNLFNYVGLRYTQPQSAALIAALMPLFAAFVLWGWTRKVPPPLTFACIVVAFLGVMLVISHGDPAGYVRGPVHWGDALCLVGSFSFAAYTIGAASLSAFSPLRFTALTASLGTLMMIGVAIVAAAVGYDTPPSGHELVAALPAIAYLAIPGVVLAMLAWNASARLIGGQNTALLGNLIAITVFVIQIARGYRPTVLELVGAAVVIGAVTANNLLLRRNPRRAHVVDEVIAAPRAA